MLIKLVSANLIDCSSQHGALAGRPLQPLTGCREGSQSHAPPVAVASSPEATPPRLLWPGPARPSNPFGSVILTVGFDCSGQAHPTGGFLPYFDLPLCSRKTLGACAVQLEKQT